MITSDPQIILTPSGDKMVVLPFAEYEQFQDLLEDLHDIFEVQETSRKIAAGEEEMIPAEVVDRLLDGPDPKLKVWREYRGLTIEQLASRSGCRVADINVIESGHEHGSPPVLKSLANALGIDLDDLV